jgi:hypothetical protein
MEVRLRRIRTSHPHFATEGTERPPGDTETLLVYRHYISRCSSERSQSAFSEADGAFSD